MAYEISSSVKNATFSVQALTASFNNTSERGMAISPDGTMAAASTYRHGSSDPGGVDYGINIYMSSSGTGWAFDHSIDVGSYFPSALKWRTSSELWAIQNNRMANWTSSSNGGWSTGSIYAAALNTGGKSMWRFNPSKTMLAQWKGGGSAAVRIYSGSAGGTSWSNTDVDDLTISGISNDAVGFAWAGEVDFIIGDPTYNSNRGRVVAMRSSDNGGSWSYNSGEAMNGASSTTSGKHQLGIWLWYHTGSNTLLVQGAQNDSQSTNNRIWYWQSSSVEGYIPASDNSLVELTRSYSPLRNDMTSHQEGNGDAILSIENYAGSYPDQQTVVIETGSSGWKVTKVGNPARNLTSTEGAISFGPSSAGGIISVPGDASGGSNPAVNRFFGMIEANPSLAASVTSSIGASGGTLSAGGTESSPTIEVTVPANALSGDTSLSAEVVSDAGYKSANLSSIKKQAGSSGAELVSDIFRMTPHGQNFSSAVTVQLELDSAPADLQIWKRDSHEGDYTQWYQLPSNLWSNDGTTVTINTTRFSEFAGLGGINVARTKLNNSQLVTLTSTDLVDSTSIRVSGSNSGKNLTVAASDLFIFEKSGATYHVSASQMAEYFGGLVTVSASSDDANMRLTFVSPSDNDDIGLAVDAGILYNPSSNLLTVGGDISVGDDVLLTSDAAAIKLGEGEDLTLTHDGTTGGTLAAGASGLVVDSAGSVKIDSDTGDISFEDGGVAQLAIDMDGTSGEIIMQLKVDSDDFVFKQYDGTEVFRVEDDGSFDIAGGAGSSGVTVSAAGQLTADGRVIIDDATEATSTTDGSLQTDGGLSVAKSVVIGDDLDLLSDGAIFAMGAGQDVTITHDGTNGATLASAGAFIIDGAAAVTVDSDAALTVGGASIDMDADGGAVAIDGTGGVNIGTATSGVAISIGHSTSEVTVNDNLTVTGDLTVNGATTTISTTNLEVEDSLILLSDGASGSPVNDQGIIFDRGSSANAALIWDESADMFKFANVGSASAASTGNLDFDATFPLSASAFYGDGANLLNVGATVRAASNNADDDQQLLFTSGAGASQTLFIDSGSLAYNASSNTLKLKQDSAAFSIGEHADVSLTHDGSTGGTLAAGASGLTIDVAGALNLDSDSGDVVFKDGGTDQLAIDMDGTAGEIIMQLKVDSDDFVFKQYDGTEVFRVEDDGSFDIAGGAGSSGVTVSAAGQLTADGRIIVDDATEATTTTDGSLQTDGGLSVAKSAVIGDDLDLLSDAAILNFGADKDVSLTHVADTGLLLNSSRQLQFGDSGTYIHQSANGVLDLVSDSEIEINATTVDINGAVDVSSTLDVDGAVTLNSVAALTVDPSDSTHHFLVTDSDDGIVKKETAQDMASIFVTHGSGALGGIKVSGGKMYIAQRELSFMSSSDNTSMSGSRPSSNVSGANVTASLGSSVLSGSVMVFLNGLLQTRSGSANLGAGSNSIWDYRLDSYSAPTKVIMSDALDSDDVLIIRYIEK